jgi:hypothetical protein
MPFKVDSSKIEGQEVFPPGIYEFKLAGFKPAKAKTGSINLNARFEMINHPEFAGRKVYDSLNEGGAFLYPEFSHALGLPMETDGLKDGSSWLPGEWNGDPAKFKEDDPATWVYKGPLVGRVAKLEIAVGNFNGRDNNKIKRYFCAVPDCATKFPKMRHIEDLLKNQK